VSLDSAPEIFDSSSFCPVTGGQHQPIYDVARGQLVCSACGLVLEENIVDTGREWRSFSQDEEVEKSRVGGRVTSKVHDGGLHTEIGRARVKNERLRKIFSKLSAINRGARVRPQDRKLVSMLHIMNQEVSKLGLPETVKDTAGNIIRELLNKKLATRFSNHKILILATIYYAAKINGYPLPFQELMDKDGYPLDVEKERLWWEALNRVQLAMKSLNLRPKVSSINYVPQIASRLNLSQKVATKASELVTAVERRGLGSGKSKVSLAASAVYIMSVLFDEKKTQKEVASVVKLTEVSIRNRYREIIESFDIIVKL
jgi:transcription initiation factor TFIIB